MSWISQDMALLGDRKSVVLDLKKLVKTVSSLIMPL